MTRQALTIGALVLAARLLTFPRTPWDAGELRFPFALMVAISIAASVVTAVAFAIAFRDPVAALLFSFSAGVLVHAPTARLDSLAWMFVSLALLMLNVGRASARPSPWGRAEARPTLFGLFAGLAVACKPEMLISMLALLFAALMVMRERRERILTGASFALVALPFVVVPEDISGVFGWNVVRFTLHPWGSKFVALPLVVCVVAGIRPLMRRWDAKIEVLMWFALVHVATGMAMVPPADGVRWAVPALMFTALLASEGLRALRVPWIGAAVLCALSVWYAYPVLRDRVTRPSPLSEALRAIPKNTVVLHDRETAFAGGLPLDAGLRQYLDRPDVPLLYVVDGNSSEPGARVFSRDDHDAWGKLTRNAYRRIALVPVAQRFAPIHGVYDVQRSEAGESWRWLEDEAEIALPQRRGPARITLRLPADARIDFNDVRVNDATIRVRRGETTTVDAGPAAHLFVRASRTFRLAPPDTRTVSVQLLQVGR